MGTAGNKFGTRTSIKRVAAHVAAISFLLSAGALMLGYLLEGNTALALTGWGLLLVPVAVVSSLVSVGSPKLTRRFQALLSRGKDLVPTGLAVSAPSSHEPTGERFSETLGCTGYDKNSDPALSPGAHFNWDTGEYEVRGSDGDFDPPYDPMKG